MPYDVQFTGYDISSDAINFAKQRLKDRLEFNNENFLKTNSTYDLLLMMDVFEHVDDYIGFLKSCKNKSTYTIFHIPLDITVEGILRKKIIYGRNTFGHLHYFTKETAISTLVDAGYEIIDFFYTTAPFDFTKKNAKIETFIFTKKIVF